MDGRRVSDFSIETILSAQTGRRPVPGGSISGIPGRLSLESVTFSSPAPVPVPVLVPVPGCLLYRGVNFGGTWCPCAAISCVHPNCGVNKHFSPNPAATDVQQLGRLEGPVQSRQKARIRTVFSDSHMKQLEALFELTDYPTVEARTELSRTTGLSEETVRVWFKNRRARRKRQHSSRRSHHPPGPHHLVHHQDQHHHQVQHQVHHLVHHQDRQPVHHQVHHPVHQPDQHQDHHLVHHLDQHQDRQPVHHLDHHLDQHQDQHQDKHPAPQQRRSSSGVSSELDS